MHKILRLKASAEHTQFREFGGERIIINLNNCFDSQKRERVLGKHNVQNWIFYFLMSSPTTEAEGAIYRKSLRTRPLE